MAHIIAVTNQKGGVGKTTTSVNLSSSLALKGKRVLLIDMDPQGNAGSGLGVIPSVSDLTIYHVLISKVGLDEVAHDTEVPGLKIIPSNTQLTGAEVELVGTFSRETHLKRALASFKSNFDYVILDCPPTIGLLTVNALTASDGVLIPLQSEYYALEGLSHLLETINMVQASLNASLKVDGILLTMMDPRNNLCRQVEKEARDHFGDLVYETVIPRNVKLSEAPSHAKPVALYDPSSRGSKAYLALAKEVILRYACGQDIVLEKSHVATKGRIVGPKRRKNKTKHQEQNA
ncbi:MAG: ParA family protein [bacterium]|nr:ParA family protein [bacterium]